MGKVVSGRERDFSNLEAWLKSVVFVLGIQRAKV